jgi:SAM-dependent methyltransferase
MDRAAFDLMADAERDHWWFRGRRDVIATAIRRAKPPVGATVLDAGCGSGGNLELLAGFGALQAFEFDARARAIAIARGICDVQAGALPDAVPFANQRFDLVGLFDVLEHLDKPVDSLSALAARLAPAGAIVLTVPVIPALWGPHDVHHQHMRRYTNQLLRDHLTSAGLRVEYLTHFNTLLLPLAIAQRVRERVLGYSARNLVPGPWLNQALYRVFRSELRLLPNTSLPFGLSLLAIARRQSPDSR